MKCAVCGTENDPSVKYCRACGTKLEIPNSQETHQSSNHGRHVPIAEGNLASPLGNVSTALPNVWVGYAIAWIILLVELIAGFLNSTPSASGTRLELVQVLAFAGGWIYWLYSVYRIHKVMDEVTNYDYPISPRSAVLGHMIPLYNLYWLVKWPNEIANELNSRLPSRQKTIGAGIFLLLGYACFWFDTALGLAAIFTVLLYLTNKIKSVLQSTPQSN
jgi:hypothetical protein